MKIIIISAIVSLVISINIGYIIEIYYLNKLNNTWQITFDEMKNITLQETKKYMHN